MFPIRLWRSSFSYRSRRRGELQDGTVFLDTASAFVRAFLHLLAGEGVWGRGRHLSPRPQQSFRILFVVLFVLKKHHRRTSRFGLGFGLLLEFFPLQRLHEAFAARVVIRICWPAHARYHAVVLKDFHVFFRSVLQSSI